MAIWLIFSFLLLVDIQKKTPVIGDWRCCVWGGQRGLFADELLHFPHQIGEAFLSLTMFIKLGL